MNKLPVVLLALLPIAAAAADQPALAFPDQKIGVPSLSLTENGRVSPLPILKDAGSWFHNYSPPAVTTKKFGSNMPILPGKTDLDSKMVKAPNLAIDYKLIVKTPNVVSTK